jgi:hypothetical protein
MRMVLCGLKFIELQYMICMQETDVVTCSFGDFVTSRGADLPHTETQDDQDYWQKMMHLNLLESASIEC